MHKAAFAGVNNVGSTSLSDQQDTDLATSNESFSLWDVFAPGRGFMAVLDRQTHLQCTN